MVRGWPIVALGTVKDELALSLRLSMQVRVTNVVDAQLVVVPVLHHSEGVALGSERVREGALEELLVANEHTVAVDTSLARQP